MAERAIRHGPSLLVFADDWGRHPSSCQHLVGKLLPEVPVWWVNTIGMRRPGLNLATFRRGMEKVRPWLSRGRQNMLRSQPAGLHVVDPRMWPWFSRGHDRFINRNMLARSLRPIVETMPPPRVAITTLPIVSDLVGRLPVDRWVYYCVDDFSTWPGLDHGTIDRMERELVDKVDVLIAASETLQARHSQTGRRVELLTHGVELDHWNTNGRPDVPKGLAPYERPLVVFWGVIDRRMDIEFVHRLADDLTAGTILLVGPVSDVDPALFTPNRVVHVPPLPYEQLPALAAQAAVLVMPYRDLPVTRAMQPLKLKEYLATGKPTVVSELPSVRAWADGLDAASTADEFSRLVRERLAVGLPDSQRTARARLTGESWTVKAAQFRQWALPEGKPS